jgi:hypothetical protein
MESNPWFAYQRNLSDAREDGDMDEYNKIKAEFKAKNNKEYGETHQCFIRI